MGQSYAASNPYPLWADQGNAPRLLRQGGAGDPGAVEARRDRQAKACNGTRRAQGRGANRVFMAVMAASLRLNLDLLFADARGRR